MRKLFSDVTEKLAAFAQQRDQAVLVGVCQQMEIAAVLQSLQTIDESSPDFFWIFTDAFEEPDQYVEQILKRCQERRAAVCQALAKEKMPLWPELPAAAADRKCANAERLRTLIIYFRSLLPDRESRVVWTLFPLSIKDPDAYAKLCGALLTSSEWPPWYHHVRFILRDEAAQPKLTELLGQNPRVRIYSPNLNQASIEKSIIEEAANESRPLEERLQNLLLLAGLDFGHQRLSAAIDKYQLLYSYYAPKGNQIMAAYVLNEIGKCFEVKGDPIQARLNYEAALPPAAETKVPPVLLNVSMNLANLSIAEKRWEDAEHYCGSVEKLALVFLMPPLRCEFLEKLGRCMHAQGKVTEAVATWEEGASLARKTKGVDELRKSILRRLHEHYSIEGPSSHWQAIDQELASLKVAL